MTPLETLVGAMTIEQLAQRASTTVAMIVEKALRGASDGPAARASRRTQSATLSSTPPAAARGAVSKAKAGKASSTRAPETRPRGSISDDEVLAILGATNEPVSSEHVRALLGGTPTQIRAALHRLRDKKRVRVSGEKRGTRYAVR